MSRQDRSLFDSFRSPGIWWLPRSPDRQLPGELAFDTGSGLRVELLGDFGGSTNPSSVLLPNVSTEPVINGVTADGAKATLTNNDRIFARYNAPGIPEQTYEAQFLFLGDQQFDRIQDIRFPSLICSYTHMENWVGRTPFQFQPGVPGGTSAGAQLTFSPPTEQSFAVSNLAATLTLTGEFRCRQVRTNSHTWCYDYYIKIEPETEQSWDWFLSAIVSTAELFTLLTWQPIFPRKVIGFGPIPTEEPKASRQVSSATNIFWRFMTPQVAPDFTRRKVCFNLLQVESQLHSSLDAWFDLRAQSREALELFFASFYAHTVNVPFYFLALTRALEGFHRSTMTNGRYHEVSTYDQLQNQLNDFVNNLTADRDWKTKFRNGEIQYGNEYSFRKRVTELIEGMPPSISGILFKDIGRFIDHIVNTRNFLTHLDASVARNALQGENLRLAFTKLQILTGLLILRKIGIPDDELETVFCQNSHIQDLLRLSNHI